MLGRYEVEGHHGQIDLEKAFGHGKAFTVQILDGHDTGVAFPRVQRLLHRYVARREF